MGAQAGAGLGGLAGIETGPGAIATAALGAMIGGAIGFFGGEAAAGELYDVGEKAAAGARMMGNPAQFLETTTLMFGTPEQRRSYYEMRSIETGEPSPFDF
jgi:hypothetical protein